MTQMDGRWTLKPDHVDCAGDDEHGDRAGGRLRDQRPRAPPQPDEQQQPRKQQHDLVALRRSRAEQHARDPRRACPARAHDARERGRRKRHRLRVFPPADGVEPEGSADPQRNQNGRLISRLRQQRGAPENHGGREPREQHETADACERHGGGLEDGGGRGKDRLRLPLRDQHERRTHRRERPIGIEELPRIRNRQRAEVAAHEGARLHELHTDVAGIDRFGFEHRKPEHRIEHHQGSPDDPGARGHAGWTVNRAARRTASTRLL